MARARALFGPLRPLGLKGPQVTSLRGGKPALRTNKDLLRKDMLSVEERTPDSFGIA